MLCRIAICNFEESRKIIEPTLLCKRKNGFGECVLGSSSSIHASPSSIAEDFCFPIDVTVDSNPPSVKCQTRTRNVRPENWRVITGHYISHGFNDTLSVFDSDLSRYNNKLPAIKKNLKLWSRQKDCTDDFLKQNVKRRMLIYGNEIDMELMNAIGRMSGNG